MKSLTAKAHSPHRLFHYTPLRYPGGKGKLAAYIKALLRINKLLDGEYVEPYAGGSAIAFELLFHEYVSRVHLNDISKPVHAFWESVLNNPDALCKLVRDTPLTVAAWDKQKKIFSHPSDFSSLKLGFAFFYLNRTNRSGILNGGIIGGRSQTGRWKIDARFNREGLIRRIESIAKMRNRVRLYRMDALEFLRTESDKWPDKTLIYLDPPYYESGRHLYYDFYRHEDHEQLRDFVVRNLAGKRWVISYDNVPPVRALYKGFQRLVYEIGYSVRRARTGSEVMFFSDSLQKIPFIV
jgi:DNA adenine methylase